MDFHGKSTEVTMKPICEISMKSKLLTLFIIVAMTSLSSFLHAQETRWMSIGSLQSWYSSIGSEIEEGRVKVQQDGLLWPAIYQYQDMEAAKAIWIAVNPHDYGGSTGPYVVHVGPRVSGLKEFFPVKFELVSKFDKPAVMVSGNQSEGKPADIDRIDPTIPSDRMIVNVVNTAAGITMTRKILGFSQQYHDNYFIYDYVFKNTGNTNADATIEKPGQTLTGVYFYWTYRYAVCADTRFVIGQNPTGWGINTMNDSRGDGNTYSPTFFPGNKDNDIRAQFSWHGKYPPFATYDNIGGPIWTPYYDKTDTVGRLGAAQFIGNATVHADKSPADTTDDQGQPSTMTYEGSDEPNTSGNDHLNPTKNSSEYDWIKRGRDPLRHADKVGPSGDPSIGRDGKTTPGGQSNASGYGPYTLGFGDSVHVVIVEAAAGLSREACIAIGRAYKWSGGNNTALITYNGIGKTKNDWVYTGRDSLFQTFRRAVVNYNSGYGIPQSPAPPLSFTVNSGAGKIQLQWTAPDDPKRKKFRVYRAIGKVDSSYSIIYESTSPSAASYNDTTAQIDVAHYYYLVSVGDPADNAKPGLNPGGELTSSRYYTQTYDPAYRRVAALLELVTSGPRGVVIVPNPYNIAADANALLYPNESDKITFKNIPGICTIRIYSELGELINTINHDDGTSTQDWYQTTSSKQIIVSGVYIVVVETPKGERGIFKFVVIR